jgi:hypothetical protein
LESDKGLNLFFFLERTYPLLIFSLLFFSLWTSKNYSKPSIGAPWPQMFFKKKNNFSDLVIVV